MRLPPRLKRASSSDVGSTKDHAENALRDQGKGKDDYQGHTVNSSAECLARSAN